MLKSELKEIIREQADRPKTDDIIEREISPKIESYQKNPFVIIISGIRRCGKSTLLWAAKKKNEGYYLNFDDERLVRFEITDFQALYESFIELYGEKNIFYFDEIQNIKGWERFIRRLHDNNKKVFITGSNATMLSRELGTHLTGRHLSLNIYPFSFLEYLDFKKIEKKENSTAQNSIIRTNFEEYLLNGGLPEYLKTKNPEYLKTLYENILYRDVLVRHKITNEKTMKDLVNFSASNISKEISFNSIKKLLNLGSPTTVKAYFEYLENSFLMFLVPKFEYSYKKQVYANKKLYMIDNGLAVYLGHRITKDSGRLLENAVFLELKRRECEIYYHKGEYECDFLCTEKLRLEVNTAIQVCYEFTDENREREINGLMKAMKTHKLKEGLILTLDQEEELKMKNKKIIVKPVWKWLLER